MDRKEIRKFAKSKKGGEYFSAIVSRLLGADEVDPKFVGHVAKTSRMVVRWVKYGHISEIENRPIDPNAKKREPTHWVKGLEDKVSYAKDGKTELVWLYSPKNPLQGTFTEYTIDGKAVSKAELLSKGILKPKKQREQSLLIIAKLKDVTLK